MTKIWNLIKLLGSKIFQFCIHYPFAIIATILIVIVGFCLARFIPNVQLGGLLSKIWGKKDSTPDAKLLPPENRVDKDGKIIPTGQSDDKGFVQAPILHQIKDPGLFDDHDKITIIHPEKGEITLPLPTGVKNKDVHQIIELNPNVYQIRNNDTGVDTKDILKDLGEK